MKHFIFAALLVAVLTVLGILGLEQTELLPAQASLQAVGIDWLFDLHFKVIAFLFALIIGFMLYSIVVFRRKKGDTEDGDHIEGNTPLEILWTVVPLGVVLYFSFLGAQVLGDVERIDPLALEVDVIGSQWSWRFEYPDYDVVSTTLVLPVDQQTVLRLSSTDVIHSFWVPEFRIKQDVLPGDKNMIRDMRITPTEMGDFTVRCAELCGTQHAYMTAPVVVMSESEFTSWLDEQAALIPDNPVDRGRLWAEQNACLTCHSTDGSELVGPTWFNVYGSQETLEDGSTVTVDDEYIYESITEPMLRIVEGFPPAMPPALSENLTNEQIADIIEFIKSLKE
ncbi:MAG: cytochrome c oxidase subunit II [Chloroflexi bacterium]|nr:cytochrome c oxidase subunit II [Chloroflexota bacterium]